MDPYLESPALWPGFHDAFVSYLREILQPLLPARYYADMKSREEIGIGSREPARVFYPDVAVREAQGPWSGAGGGVRSAVKPAAPEHLVIALGDPLEVSFLEIREVGEGDRLVTVIEVLSPSNKAPGTDREAFERKQDEVFGSETHWVEIDLLRQGRRLGGHPLVDAHCQRQGYDYIALVSRSRKRSPLDLEIYGFSVRDPLPAVQVPLAEPDPDVVLDLGAAFRRAYESGPYRKIVRYDLPPPVPLRDEDASWAREVISKAGAAAR
jgi:hypothetical protein